MKVCELIELLRQFNQNTEVCITEHDGFYSSLNGDVIGCDYNPAGTRENSPSTIFLVADLEGTM